MPGELAALAIARRFAVERIRPAAQRAKETARAGRLGVVAALFILASPLVLEARRAGNVYRIGVLENEGPASNAANLGALRKRLSELGYVEGQNLVIEYRSADGRAERFWDLAAELVRLQVDAIVARGDSAALAAKIPPSLLLRADELLQ
jgi:Fe2+ transport system protein FeoA